MKIKHHTYRSFTIWVGMALLAILLFLLIPLSYRISLPLEYWINQFIFFLLLVSLIYFNTKYLAPHLLFQKKPYQYYSILFICCILIILILQQTEDLLNIPEAIHNVALEAAIKRDKRASGLSVAFYIFLVEVLVLGVNIAGIIVRKWEADENLRLIAEKEKTDLELAFLKSQINPHFFFNSLNTINALTYSNVEEARLALKKLSTIMRYVLYNSLSETVALGKEIEFIKNYLELMKLRSSSKVSIELLVEVENEDISIAPMIFLSLIENCFKHGVSTQQESPIFISIHVGENTLTFCTKNKIFKKYESKNGAQQHGIGLQNTKRRLALIYPKQHSLSIDQSDDEYKVELKINL